MTKKDVSNPFEALFINATVGILVVNAKGEICMINDFGAAMMGYKKEELTGQQLEILIPHRFREKHKVNHQNFYKKPVKRAMGRGPNFVALRKNKKEIPVDISLGTYKDQNQDFAIAIITDISEKKKKEEALNKLTAELEKKVERRTHKLSETVKKLKKTIENINEKDKALQETNRFLEGLLLHAPSIIIVTDAHGKIRIFNQCAERMLGYSAREIINKKNISQFHCKEETEKKATQLSHQMKERVEPGLESLIAAAKKNITRETEWTYIRKDKSRFPVSLTVSAILDENNQISGYLWIAIDITERKKVMDEMSNALDKERQLGELKTRFVSVASHEFRTPLSTILSSVYLLSKYTTTEEQPKRDKHIQRIDGSIKELNDLLNDFLSLGKIEEGKIQVRWSQFDIAHEILESIEELKTQLKPGQHFTFSHKGPNTVLLDPSLLKHILLNLLSNAIKFSPENSSIAITSSYSGNQLGLVIKDQGIGIPRNEQAHIFERFFRASNADNIKGTGLGLHIVLKYTELLNGSIRYKSDTGKGTEFILSFKTSS
ncbi:MAG: PAS domain S-box protein [Terrimonas sp.]|nr:PAS domain S-box protein [Terrimonas sp.]